MNPAGPILKAQAAVESRCPSSCQLSVLVPVYNGERYLAECLDSILRQDFAGMEILIADDQSSDRSEAIIREYAARDGRIRWWQNPRRAGLTGNSNICLRAATGEYVKFVHQDDKLLCASALRKLVKALESHPTAALAGSRQHVTGKNSPPAVFRCKNHLCDGRQMIVTCLERNTNLIGQPSLTLFRRSLAGRGFDERFVGLMDYEMWCHLLDQGDYVYLDEPLATWRVHENQQTARNRQSGDSDNDGLMLVDTYYARLWLQKAATRRLLFTQIYYLRKKYGRAADHLIRKMTAQLPLHYYTWQWLRHKTTKPFLNLSRRLNPQ